MFLDKLRLNSVSSKHQEFMTKTSNNCNKLAQSILLLERNMTISS